MQRLEKPNLTRLYCKVLSVQLWLAIRPF